MTVKIVTALFALVAVLALTAQPASSQTYASQGFLAGQHYAFGLEISQFTFSYINDYNFNIPLLNQSLSYLTYGTQYGRDSAIQSLYRLYYSFSTNLYSVLIQDPNFTIVLNYTLTVLYDPAQFLARATLYRQRSGRDAYDDLLFSYNQLWQGDYRGAGYTFGLLMFNLGRVYGDAPAVPALEELLEAPVDTDIVEFLSGIFEQYNLPYDGSDIAACIGEESQTQVIQYIEEISDSVTRLDIPRLTKIAQEFDKNVLNKIGKCLYNAESYKALGSEVSVRAGVKKITVQHVLARLAGRFPTFQKEIKSTDAAIRNNELRDAGVHFAKAAQAILDK